MIKHRKWYLSVLAVMLALAIIFMSASPWSGVTANADETIPIVITKEWNDANNADGSRPDNVRMQIRQNGELWRTVELSAENGWELTIDDAPLRDAGGNKYEYTLVEELPDGYSSNVQKTEPEDRTMFTVTIEPNEDAPYAGDTFTYTVEVANNSTYDGTLDVTATLDDKVRVDSATDSGTVKGNTVTWSGLAIEANETKTMTITATAREDGDVTATVTASINGHSATGSYDHEIQWLPEIRGFKMEPVDPPVSVEPGETVTLTWRITVQGDEGSEYSVTVPTATVIGGSTNGMIGASLQSIIYVSKDLTAPTDRDVLEYRNTATVKANGKTVINAALNASISEKTSIPVKTPEPETLTVTWVDENGAILEGPKSFIKGTAEPTTTLIPQKDPDGVNSYVFDGWTRSVDTAGNVTYKATYSAVPMENVTITVRFVDDAGVTVHTSNLVVAKGATYDASNMVNQIPNGYQANGSPNGDALTGIASSDKMIMVPVKEIVMPAPEGLSVEIEPEGVELYNGEAYTGDQYRYRVSIDRTTTNLKACYVCTCGYMTYEKQDISRHINSQHLVAGQPGYSYTSFGVMDVTVTVSGDVSVLQASNGGVIDGNTVTWKDIAAPGSNTTGKMYVTVKASGTPSDVAAKAQVDILAGTAKASYTHSILRHPEITGFETESVDVPEYGVAGDSARTGWKITVFGDEGAEYRVNGNGSLVSGKLTGMIDSTGKAVIYMSRTDTIPNSNSTLPLSGTGMLDPLAVNYNASVSVVGKTVVKNGVSTSKSVRAEIPVAIPLPTKLEATYYMEDFQIIASYPFTRGQEAPEYQGTPPAKASDSLYTYTFDHWFQDTDTMGNVTFLAKYTRTPRSSTVPYKVCWYDTDGKLLKEETRAGIRGTTVSVTTDDKELAGYAFVDGFSDNVTSTTLPSRTTTAAEDLKLYFTKFASVDGKITKVVQRAFNAWDYYIQFDITNDTESDLRGLKLFERTNLLDGILYFRDFAAEDRTISVVSGNGYDPRHTIRLIPDDETFAAGETVSFTYVMTAAGLSQHSLDEYINTFDLMSTMPVTARTRARAMKAPEVKAIRFVVTNTHTPAERCTVTYKDGFDGSLFKDYVVNANIGDNTPEYPGTPERKGHVFKGWEPDIAETVSGPAVYTAKWEIKPHIHVKGSENIIKDPTCTEDGLKVLICEVCGQEYGEYPVAALGHSDEVLYADKGDGTHTVTCTQCDEIIKTEPHAFGEWYDAGDVMRCDCEKCGAVSEREKDAVMYTVAYDADGKIVSHEYEEGTQITVGGNVATEDRHLASWTFNGDTFTPGDLVTVNSDITFVGVFEDHTFEEHSQAGTCIEAGSSWQICTVCGYETEHKSTGLAEHTYVDQSEPGSCIKDGYIWKQCSVCGYETERVSTGKTEHTYQERSSAGTCTESGYTWKECTVCGNEIDRVATGMAEHDYQDKSQAATCTTPGAYWKECVNCGHQTSRVETGFAEHNYKDRSQTATCTKDGATWKECVVCGQETDRVIVPASGHAIGDWTDGCGTHSDKRCEEHVKICTKCGEIVEHEAHAYGAWETKTDAKYTFMTRTCSCGHKQTIKAQRSVITEYNGRPQSILRASEYEDIELGMYVGSLFVSYQDKDGAVLNGHPKNAGDYTATVEVRDDDDAAFASFTINYTIEPAVLTVKYKSETISVNGKFKGAIEVDGFMQDDVDMPDFEFPSIDVREIDFSKPGSYTVTPAGGTVNSNYIFQYVPGTLTIVEDGTASVLYQGYGSDPTDATYAANAGTQIVVDLNGGKWEPEDKVWANGHEHVLKGDEHITLAGRFTRPGHLFLGWEKIEEATKTIFTAHWGEVVLGDIRNLTYNGKPQTPQPTVTVDGIKLDTAQYAVIEYRDTEGKILRLEDGAPKNAGKYTAEFVVKNALGVTECTVSGDFEIRSAVLTVKTESAQSIYSGKALQAPGTIEGLMGNDAVTLKVTGSQTEIGSSKNTYEIEWGDVLAANYEIKEELGELTVKEAGEELAQAIDLEAVIGWDDASDHDTLRPKSVEIELYQNGKVYLTGTADQDSNWRCVFKVDKFDETGREYAYTVSVKAPDGYESEIDGYSIRLKHVPTTALNVNIVWVDRNNKDKTRPDEVEAVIYQNDKAFRTLTVAEKDGWKISVKDLPKFDDMGNEYTYAFGYSKMPDGYKAEVRGTTITFRREAGSSSTTTDQTPNNSLRPNSNSSNENSSSKGSSPSKGGSNEVVNTGENSFLVFGAFGLCVALGAWLIVYLANRKNKKQ